MSEQKVNLRHFFALVDIAETGRISEAAERINVSQSALTQALRNLEDVAQLPLFERVGFGVAPTAGGESLVRRARRSVDILAQAKSAINARSSPTTAGSPLLQHVTASQLRALVAVADAGSYSAAAQKLRLAQPTVHRSVRKLGASLGCDLFRRDTHGVKPTPAASVLARAAELVFAEIRQGFEEIRELDGRPDGRIAVGSLPLVRSEFLPAAVTRLLDRNPEARVSILDGPYTEQLRALRYGRVDWLIGALRHPPPAADVRQEALFDQPLAVVVRPGHPLLRSPSPDISELANLGWVAPRPGVPARTFFDEFFTRNSVSAPSEIIECSSLIATRGILLQSDRAALLSPVQIREDIAADELAVLLDAIPGSSRTIGMTVRDNWAPTMLQAEFMTIVRELATAVNT